MSQSTGASRSASAAAGTWCNVATTRAFGAAACTAAAREGIAAFLEHRAPDFGASG
jgi:hypothetical protein